MSLLSTWPSRPFPRLKQRNITCTTSIFFPTSASKQWLKVTQKSLIFCSSKKKAFLSIFKHCGTQKGTWRRQKKWFGFGGIKPPPAKPKRPFMVDLYLNEMQTSIFFLGRTFMGIYYYINVAFLLAISDPSTSIQAWYRSCNLLLSLQVSIKEGGYLHTWPESPLE